MNSRAASAATSRRVSQELVRLLFGRESSSETACRIQTLDYSLYSYADLRAAYLERLQQLHPDKKYHANNGSKCPGHSEFVELQEAWDRYDEMAKTSKTADGQGPDKDRNFTLFGVGCSFSDTDEERALRTEITDQACRGWFSAGTLAACASSQRGGTPHRPLPLLNDDMFVQVDATSADSKEKFAPHGRRPSLVDPRFRPRSHAG